MGDFNSAYLAVRQDRNKAEMEKALAEADAVVAAQQPPTKAPAAAPAAAPTKAPAEKSAGVMQETKRAVMGGIQDAAYNVTHMADEFAGWLNDNFLHMKAEAPTRFVRPRADENWNQAAKRLDETNSLAGLVSGKSEKSVIPKVAENQTTAGKVSRALVTFGTTFAGTAALTGGVGGGALANMGRGAVTDFAANDPSDGNLSNLILEVTKGDPFLGKSVAEMLATDPNDNAAWNRSRNVLEGAGLGAAAEGLVKAVRYGVGKWRGAGKDPLQVVQEASAVPQPKSMEELAQEPAFMRSMEATPVDTAKAPDMGLADQINILTGVTRNGPSKFQKALDMKAALADAEKTAQPKGLELADGALPGTRKAGDPDAFLKNGSADTKLTLEDPNAVPFSRDAATADTPSFPDSWKMVEQDPTPRKLFLDTQDGHMVMAKEAAGPHQMDLDLALPEVLKKAERTPDEDAMLKGYKELQEKVLEAAPKVADEVAPEAADLEARIAKAQARVDALTEAGKDTTTAQKVLDNLLKKKDGGLFDASAKLSGKEADQLATHADPIVDEIAANNEKILAAAGKQQGGFVSPSMLANLASANLGAVGGFLSAEDDATFAERMGLAGVGALAGLGVKVGASKVLSPAEHAAQKAVIDSPDPVAKALARPSSDGIAPLTEAMAAKRPNPIIHMSKVTELAQAAREGRLGEVAKGAAKDSINFSRIDTEDDVKELFNAVQATFDKEFDKARGGAVRTHEEVARNAELVGTSLKSLEDHYQQFANMDSKMLADRHLLVASAEKVRDLIREAAESGDDFAMLALEKQIKLHAVIQAKVKGMASEAARALSAMRIHANSADLAINEAHALLESMGGKVAKLDYYKQLLDIPTDGGFNKAIRMGAMARTKDALVEMSVLGKLWAPTTHVANMVGNTITAVLGPVEKATASMIGKYITRNADHIEMAEAKAQLFGMVGGIQDALAISSQGLDAARKAAGQALGGDFSAAKNTLADNVEEFGSVYRSAALDAPVGRSSLDATMDAGAHQPAITAERFNLDAEKPMGILVDALGTLNRIPGRALGASDELFWAINYRGEVRAQAFRAARQEGLEGEDLIARVAELVENPTQEMRSVAVQSAQKGTFTEPLTGFGKGLQEFVDGANLGFIPAGRLFVPFVKTPYNIMKYFAERTPILNRATDAWKADVAAGGIRRDMAMAKTTTGSMLLGTGVLFGAAQDFGGVTVQIVGGGDRTQASEKLNGEQQYSLKIGDKSYSFNRLAPLGMFLGLGADIRDIAGHIDDSTLDEIVAASTLAFSRNITNQSMLSGVLDFISATQKASSTGSVDPLYRYLDNQAAGALPFSSLANTVRKEDDPLAREVWGLIDAIKNKTPGFSKDLPPQVNLFGEPVHNPEALGPDILSPIRTSVSDTDPLASEIARLNIDLKKPPKTLATAPGAPGIDLTPEQYHTLSVNAGQMFKKELGKTFAMERYKNLPEDPEQSTYREAKETVIRRIHTQTLMVATRQLIANDPELHAKWVGEKKNAAAALSGRPMLPF